MGDDAPSTGSMLALYPPRDLARLLATPGGEPAGALHLTIAYTGKAAQVNQSALNRAAARLTGRPPIRARVGGVGRFVGTPDGDVAVLLVDSPELETLRRDARDALAAEGVILPDDHGFIPHITLAYLDEDAPHPLARVDPVEVVFQAVTAAHAGTRVDYPLTPPAENLVARAREAYAQGWAASGGPLTERVRAGAAAVMRMAAEQPHDPHILEVSLHLGRLEGVWATVYQRRETLIASLAATAALAWRKILDRAAIRDWVTAFRRAAEQAPAGMPVEQVVTEAAAAAARTVAAHVGASKNLPELQTALRDAVAAGRAEGAVAAVAVAAEQAGAGEVAWDDAYAHMYAAMERLGSLWADADGWLAQMVGRAGDQLGRALAQAQRDGASYEDMVSAAMDVMDSDDVEAVAFTVDWATTTALDQGALDLYAMQQVPSVQILTAGDGRVCSTCEAFEAGNPYTVYTAPRLPPHPRCRCTYVARLDMSRFSHWLVQR